jgi:hypothetical protein
MMQAPVWTGALAAFAAVVNGFHAFAAEEAWGAVRGRIVCHTAAEATYLKVDRDQDHCLSRGPLVDEKFVVNSKNHGVRWAFVWLAPGETGQPLRVHKVVKEQAATDVVIDQPTCQFVPHAVALRQGQRLVIRNSAPIVHNVNWAGSLKNPGNNLALASGQSLTISNLAADRLPLRLSCTIHPWMTAWVRVFDHPYFAVTGANGEFVIADAPAGRWRLIVWQESIGYRGQDGQRGIPIEIQSGGTTDLGELTVQP